MYSFFAYLSRLKLIDRWSLMRNTQRENDAEHSLQVAMIAHMIALIGVKRYRRDSDPEHIMTLAVYHDATEVLTGDLPTPVKYFNHKLRDSYHELESLAAERLLHMLPEDLTDEMRPLLNQEESYERTVVKAADRISAYLKCLEEQRAGNHEFDHAGENILSSLETITLPEVKDFMDDFVPAFLLTLDELNDPHTFPSEGTLTDSEDLGKK